MSVQGERKLLKGDLLFQEGEPAKTVFLVKTGRISLFIHRDNHKIELAQLGANQIVGDSILAGMPKRTYSAEAHVNSHILELPVEALKGKVETADSLTKVLVKSLAEEVKGTLNTIRDIKMEQDASPCPQKMIPRIFGTINLVGRYLGKEEGEGLVIDWGVLKMYTVRTFLETLPRMEGVCQILSKLGCIDLIMQKNDDDEDELAKIRVKQLQKIEDFMEFYQYNLYKGARSEAIIIDQQCLTLAKGLALFSEDLEPDRKGVVRISSDLFTKKMKAKFRFDFKITTHLPLLSNKGLFVTSKGENQEVFLYYEKQEISNLAFFWQLINEINKWNETGTIDMTPDTEEEEEASSDCPDCGVPYVEGQKFCGDCGAKLTA